MTKKNNQEEIFDIVDEEDRIIGSAPRRPHRPPALLTGRVLLPF